MYESYYLHKLTLFIWVEQFKTTLSQMKHKDVEIQLLPQKTPVPS